MMKQNRNNKFKMLINKYLTGLAIRKNNEKSTLFLVYNKYTKAVRSFVCSYFNSLVFIKDFIDKVYVLLKWKKPDEIDFKKCRYSCVFFPFITLLMLYIFNVNREETFWW